MTLDEMWSRLAAHQPHADAKGYGEAWLAMCVQHTPEAARAAADAAAAARAAWVAASAARAAANLAEAAQAAEWAAEWAERAIEYIKRSEGA